LRGVGTDHGRRRQVNDVIAQRHHHAVEGARQLGDIDVELHAE
jgi:hypothetical protein